MKKLLSILAAVGLTATASTAVVACSSKSPKFAQASVDSKGHVTYFTNDIIMAYSFASTKDVEKQYGVFDANRKFVKSDITSADATSFKRDVPYKFTVSFDIKDYKPGDKHKFYFGTVGKDNMMGKELASFIPTYVDGSHQVEKHVAKTETFMATSVDAAFTKKPTKTELAKDFAVKDNNGKIIDGVQYAFIESKSDAQKAYVLADNIDGIKGKVSIKIPAKKDAPVQQVKVTLTAEGQIACPTFSKDGVEAPKPVEFTLDGVAINNTDASQLTVDSILNNMADDTAKRVYKALFDKDGSKNDLISNAKSLVFSAAKGMDINADDVNTPFSADNGGSLINNTDVLPDGSQYQIGLHNGNKYYWFNLSFDKVIAGKVVVSNFQVSDSNTLVAQLGNAGQYSDTDISKQNMVKVVVNNSILKASDINSALVDDDGSLTISLNTSLQKGDAVKLDIINNGNDNTETKGIIYGDPSVTDVQVIDAHHVIAQVKDDTPILGTDLVKTDGIKFICGSMGEVPLNMIESAELQSDGKLNISLHHTIELGCTVKVSVKNSLGEYTDYSDPSMYGTPSVTDVQVKNSEFITAKVNGDYGLTGDTGRDLLAEDAVQVVVNQRILDNSEIMGAGVDKDGNLIVRLNSELKPGSLVGINVTDALGNWHNSEPIIYGTPRVNEVKLSKDGLTANLINNIAVLNQDLLKQDAIEINVNGYGWSSENIKSATVDANGKLNVKFNEDIENGSIVSVRVSDALGNWDQSDEAMLGTPKVQKVKVTDNGLTANLINNIALKNADLLDQDAIEINVNGYGWSSENIKSAISKNGKLTVKFNKNISRGDILKVRVSDAFGNWHQSENAMDGKIEIANVKVVSATEIDAQNNYNKFLDNQTFSTDDDVVEVSINNQDWDDSIVNTVNVDKNGAMKVTLKTPLKGGDQVAIRVVDGLGNWNKTDPVVYGNVSIENVVISKDGSNISADVLNDNPLYGRDLLDEDAIEVSTNGKQSGIVKLTKATLSKDGKLNVTLAKPLKDQEGIYISVLNATGDWSNWSSKTTYTAPVTGPVFSSAKYNATYNWCDEQIVISGEHFDELKEISKSNFNADFINNVWEIDHTNNSITFKLNNGNGLEKDKAYNMPIAFSGQKKDGTSVKLNVSLTIEPKATFDLNNVRLFSKNTIVISGENLPDTLEGKNCNDAVSVQGHSVKVAYIKNNKLFIELQEDVDTTKISSNDIKGHLWIEHTDFNWYGLHI